MAKIGEILLSAGENKELINIFRRIPSKEIKPFKTIISPGSPDEKESGKRIEEVLNGDYELTQEQIDLIYKYSPCRYLFDYFSKQILEEFGSELASLIGKDLFKLMLLVLNKHRKAKESDLISLYKNINFVQNRADESKEKLTEFLNKKIGKCLGMALEEAESSGSKRIAELQQQAVSLTSKLSQSEREKENQRTEFQKEISQFKADRIKHNEELQNKDREIKRLNEIISQKDNEIKRLSSEKKNIADEYEKFKLEFETKVKEEAEKKMRELIVKMFPAADSIRKELNTNQSMDIIKEAREMLNKQAKIDQVYGDRVELNKRLQELSEINNKLKEAIQNSINLTPNIQSVANKVEKEISRITGILGREQKESDYLNLLYGLIGSEENVEQLDTLCEFVNFLFGKKILSEEEWRDVYGRLYGKYECVRFLPTPKFREFGLSVIRYLRENLDSIIILDAHNIINNDELKPYFSSNDHKKTREKFESIIKSLAQGRNKVKFYIVYDGPEYKSETIAANIKVYYSGGEGEHRADNFIIENIKSDGFGETSGKRFIVTDDYELAKELYQNDVIKIPLIQFYYVLKEFQVI